MSRKNQQQHGGIIRNDERGDSVMLEIGDRVRDKVTGKRYIVNGWALRDETGLFACRQRCLVMSTAYYDPSGTWLLESQLEKVERNDGRGDGG